MGAGTAVALPESLQLRVLVRHDNVLRVLGAADVPVSSPAYGVGFSNAIAEAMATGLPVVATDVGDARRIVGDAGRIVPPRDPDTLAAALADIMVLSDRWWIYLRWNAPLKSSIFCIGWDRMPRRYRPQRKDHEGFIKRVKFIGNSPLTWGAACV